jgi:hypothetical protein
MAVVAGAEPTVIAGTETAVVTGAAVISTREPAVVAAGAETAAMTAGAAETGALKIVNEAAHIVPVRGGVERDRLRRS